MIENRLLQNKKCVNSTCLRTNSVIDFFKFLKCTNLFILEDDGPIGQAPSTPAPKPPASSKPALPFKPATPAKPTNALGLVNPFPGMDPMKSLALRENKAKMGPKLEQLLANGNGRKQSVPTVPTVTGVNAPRKGSEPVVSTTHLLQARFNKQVSVDSGTDQLATLVSGSDALTDPYHPRRRKQPAEVLLTAHYRLCRLKLRPLRSHQVHPCRVTRSLHLQARQGLLEEQVQFL